MAGVWTPPNNYNGKKMNDPLAKQRLENKYLREQIHNQVMSLRSGQRKKEKLLREKSDFKSVKRDKNEFNSSLTTEELAKKLEHYGDQINRLREQNKKERNLNAIKEAQDIKIKSIEKRINELESENPHKEKYLEIKEAYKKAIENGSRNSINFEPLFALLPGNKAQKKRNILFYNGNKHSSPIIKEEKNLSEEKLMPFYEYCKPIDKKNVMMKKLNSYIAKFNNCGNRSNKELLSNQVTDYFNRAQSVAFLYPKTTQFVTLKESREAQSEGSESDPLVAETDWPLILQEFIKRQDELPSVLMLLVRELGEDGFKNVLLVVDLNCLSILRYDPLGEPINSRKNYQYVYDKVFRNFTRQSQWLKNHIDEDKDGITWLYCIEFARRFAMKSNEDGKDWVQNNLMRGNTGGCKAFAFIEFDA